jgi:hypothetical protein
MRVQHIRKQCTAFKNGPMDNNDDDCTGWPSISRIDVNATRVVRTDFGKPMS